MAEQEVKRTTLLIVHQDGRVLLGMKKRGFGVGRWNGFGGKLEPGETVEAAARRETEEEAGIRVNDLVQLGRINFEFKGKTGLIEVNIFKSTDYSGTPLEGEEMKPQWFDLDKIPFGEMWPDDPHWMPLFLTGKKFTGYFLFGEDAGNTIIKKELNVVDKID